MIVLFVFFNKYYDSHRIHLTPGKRYKCINVETSAISVINDNNQIDYYGICWFCANYETLCKNLGIE